VSDTRNDQLRTNAKYIFITKKLTQSNVQKLFKNGAQKPLEEQSVFTHQRYGLALGLACSLLIMLWVNDEYKVDAFHKNGTQLYSVYERQNHDGQWSAFHGTPGVMADEMKRMLPEVQYAQIMHGMS
jgi:hypothetical protein